MVGEKLAPQLAAGGTLGHYRIMEKIGAGGMGVVYKGRDMHLDRLVALKVLPQGTVADSESRRRFAQEAKAASALNHRTSLRFTTSVILTAWTSSRWST